MYAKILNSCNFPSTSSIAIKFNHSVVAPITVRKLLGTSNEHLFLRGNRFAASKDEIIIPRYRLNIKQGLMLL